MASLEHLLEASDLETLLSSGFALDVEETQAELDRLPEEERRITLLRIAKLNNALKDFIQEGGKALSEQREKVLQAPQMKTANLLYRRYTALVRKNEINE